MLDDGIGRLLFLKFRSSRKANCIPRVKDHLDFLSVAKDMASDDEEQTQFIHGRGDIGVVDAFFGGVRKFTFEDPCRMIKLASPFITREEIIFKLANSISADLPVTILAWCTTDFSGPFRKWILKFQNRQNVYLATFKNHPLGVCLEDLLQTIERVIHHKSGPQATDVQKVTPYFE